MAPKRAIEDDDDTTNSKTQSGADAALDEIDEGIGRNAVQAVMDKLQSFHQQTQSTTAIRLTKGLNTARERRPFDWQTSMGREGTFCTSNE